VLLLFHYS